MSDNNETYRPTEFDDHMSAIEPVLKLYRDLDGSERADIIRSLTGDTMPEPRRAVLHWHNDRVDENDEDSTGWRCLLLDENIEQKGHVKAFQRLVSDVGSFAAPAITAADPDKAGRLISRARDYGLAWTSTEVPCIDGKGDAEPRVVVFAVWSDS